EWDMIIPMGSVPVTFVILGFLISKVPSKEHVPQLSVALVAVALTWFLSAVIGSLPFMLALQMTPTDSIFEAMSGWTDTGITMMSSIDTAPKTLIFWRSLMQWIGGIGVISLGIAMQSRSTLAQYRLWYLISSRQSETTGLERDS
ncbi:MAG TPA: potassium transporter TrkG, partial [Methanoregulaceae archaeon]|nr:potassium transporter TrkG [Methanoregulaceae archaeon]